MTRVRTSCSHFMCELNVPTPRHMRPRLILRLSAPSDEPSSHEVLPLVTSSGAKGVDCCLVVEFTNLINPCSGLMKLPGAHYLQRLGDGLKNCSSAFPMGTVGGET